RELIDRIVARLESGDFAGAASLANGEMMTTAERASAALSRSLEYNVAATRQLAEDIEATRTRAMVIEGALDGLSAALALVAGFVLFRAVRHYAALLNAHHHLTERRADELEQFAGRVAHDILSPLAAAGMALAIAE